MGMPRISRRDAMPRDTIFLAHMSLQGLHSAITIIIVVVVIIIIIIMVTMSPGVTCLDSHSETDVGLLERGGVVGAVAGNRNSLLYAGGLQA